MKLISRDTNMPLNAAEDTYRARLARDGFSLTKGKQPVKGLRHGYMITDTARNFAVLGTDHWHFDASWEDVIKFARAC